MIRGKLPWTETSLERETVFKWLHLPELLGSRGPGQNVEFGVHDGRSLRVIATFVYPQKVYGFDSFKGLAEPWGDFPIGQWAFDHTTIRLPDNAELVIGWFADTVPVFVKEHPEPFAYCVINSGLYSSAKTILTNIENNIIVGSILLFGEIRRCSGCGDEIRAFNEYLERTGSEWEILGCTTATNVIFKRMA